MSVEPIIIEIDDTQLDVALIKLDLLGAKTAGLFGGGGKGGSKRLTSVLLTVNRELRLILGRVGGMRQVMQTLFALRRLERGKHYLKLGDTFPALLTAVATAAILITTLQQHMQRVKKNQDDYERLIRRARGWTHDEFVRGQNEWQEYRKSMPG